MMRNYLWVVILIITNFVILVSKDIKEKKSLSNIAKITW